MSDLQEFEKTRKLRAASFMMQQHRQACEEQGDDPEEVDTFYSLAADALSRALPAVQPDADELVGHMTKLIAAGLECIEQLTAERDRYRKALEDIIKDYEPGYPLSHDVIKYVARMALKGESLE